MDTLNLRPTYAPVKKYFAALAAFQALGITHELAVKSAFKELLSHCARQMRWTLVPEQSLPGATGNRIAPDATFLDAFRLKRGFWEAKDEADDLAREAQKKFALGYPKTNILFQSPTRALLYRHGVPTHYDLTDPQQLVDALKFFFAYTEPEYDKWEHAVLEFKDRIPDIVHKDVGLNSSTTNEHWDASWLLQRAVLWPRW